ncbi:MAG: hypothetical protein KKB70_02610 [Proteobacteria bacterium]|nr:hypothetical protein [Pseudomonadota bacterium]
MSQTEKTPKQQFRAFFDLNLVIVITLVFLVFCIGWAFGDSGESGSKQSMMTLSTLAYIARTEPAAKQRCMDIVERSWPGDLDSLKEQTYTLIFDLYRDGTLNFMQNLQADLGYDFPAMLEQAKAEAE